jgi:hypothetical protein
MVNNSPAFLRSDDIEYQNGVTASASHALTAEKILQSGQVH